MSCLFYTTISQVYYIVNLFIINLGKKTLHHITKWITVLFSTFKDLQILYFPMLSLKKTRKIVTLHVHTIKVGNKFLVSKDQLEKLLSNPDIKIL